MDIGASRVLVKQSPATADVLSTVDGQSMTTGPLQTARLRVTATRDWINSLSNAGTFLLVLLPLLALYLATASRDNQNVDSIAAAAPAWRLATHGDLNLEQFEGLPWIIETEDGFRSNRQPGVIAFGVPFYMGSDSTLSGRLPPLTPAAVAGAVSAALAMATLQLAFRRLTSPTTAVVAALIGGTATATWRISADQLWPHGPAQLWLALGVLSLAAGWYFKSGLMLGLALLTRPVTAVAAATIGLAYGTLVRRLRPIVLIGAGATAGLLGLMTYNQIVFDSFSPTTSAYGDQFTSQAGAGGTTGYLSNLGGFFFHPANSLFLWSPFLLVLVFGIPRAWRAAPPWVRAAALSGVIYLLVHAALNRQSGGLQRNYRYPLEMLTLAAPLLVLAYDKLVARSPRLQRVFGAAVVASIVIQANDALTEYVSLILEG